MGISRLTKIGLAGGGALLVSAAVVAITAYAAGVPIGASAATSSNSRQNDPVQQAAQQYCQVFMNNFAKDLGHGLKSSDVQKAAQTALGQTLDQAVKDGKITAAQAAQMKQRAASGNLCGGLGVEGIGRQGGHGMGGAKAGLGAAYLADSAKALGMSETDLMTALKGGQTMQQIAQSRKGWNEQQFRDALTAQVKADLDAKVQAKTITQAQEDEVLNKLKTSPLPFWSQSMPQRPNKPAPAPTSATT